VGLCAHQVAWQAQTQKAPGLSSGAFELAEQVVLVAGGRINRDRTADELERGAPKSKLHLSGHPFGAHGSGDDDRQG
jgi:hypothetical protein